MQLQGPLFLFILNGIITFSDSIGIGSIRVPDGKNPLLAPSDPDDKYFEQKLDHFDTSESRTWNQKYFSEDKYYEKGGPVYLRISDRGILNSKMMSSGYWYTNGKKNKAMFFYISHRYYDLTMPVSSAVTKELRFLSANQALADFAAFIKSKNEEHNFPDGTKWIVFGSYYAANLAAWMRSKYPDLVYGAVASSAPVLAKMDFTEYLDNVANIIGKQNEKCKKDITAANKELDKLVRTQKGRKDVENIFKRICDPLDGGKFNISIFSTSVTDYISDVVQYDFEHEKTQQICHKMMEEADSKKPINRYASVITMLMDEQNADCLPTRVEPYLDLMKAPNIFFALLTGKIWMYQVCHEFGWFQTSTQRSNTFSKNVNLNFFVYLCSEIFGPSVNKKFINEAVAKTNKLFGGLKVNTPRTLFIHGDSDPWKSAQITSKKENKNVDIITIKGGSLSSDIFYGDSNKEAMVNAIKEINKKLDSWVQK